MPQISATVIPTGGAVRLDMPGYVVPASGVMNMVLSRAVSTPSGTAAFTTLYSGVPQPVYVDIGDGGLPGPLNPSTGYMYRLVDDLGSAMVGPVVPAPSLVVQEDPLTNMLIRLLQAGISSNPLPNSPAPVVTTKMPVGGLQALPFIVVNLDLMQQSQIGIGQGVAQPQPIPNQPLGNQWTIWINAKRVWRVSILSTSVEERDYYRSLIISCYQVILATVWQALGVDVTHDVQAASGTDANEWEGKIPGFYYADVMLTADGVLNTTVVTGYGIIRQFDVFVDQQEGAGEAQEVFEFIVPPSA